MTRSLVPVAGAEMACPPEGSPENRIDAADRTPVLRTTVGKRCHVFPTIAGSRCTSPSSIEGPDGEAGTVASDPPLDSGSAGVPVAAMIP